MRFGRKGLAVAATLVWAANPTLADEAPFNWTGFYVGAHAGGGIAYGEFSNPYGPNLFGGETRSPGPFVGGQIGYNFQDGIFVYGLQADASWANLRGAATCMQPARSLPGGNPQFMGAAFGGTCQSELDWFGTFTARGGVALGEGGRVLVYGKGGLAWLHNDVEMAQNNILAPDAGPPDASSGSSSVQWGWTLGAGLEYALSSRWSLGFEYDYLSFANRTVVTPASGPMADPTFPGIDGSTALDGRAARASHDLHTVKLALNYALNDRGEVASELGPAGLFVPGTFGRGLQVEIGGRYVYGWSRFQQDLGKHYVALPANASRLTWEDVGTGGPETYWRVDTPWNFVLKGIVGVGRGSSGEIFDEDWGLTIGDPPTEVVPYQITRSDISSSLNYFSIDGGYNIARTDTYRITPFVGYNYFHYKMNALGCSFQNFAPALPCNGAPTMVFLQETDKWRSLRLGTSAELMLTPQLKVAGEVAYLPYVSYAGVDNHPRREDAIGTTRSPQNGVGTGVQLEGVVSYDLTDQISVGVGARFWSMQVPKGLTNFFSSNEFTQERFSTEHTAIFAQGSYKFGMPD